MTTPRLTMDLDRIEHNARTIVALCQSHGIEVCGVTKAVCGDPEVARAMQRGGVASIADSRLENIRRLRAAGIDTDFLSLRVPAVSSVEAIVDLTDFSLNSELAVLEALSAAAQRRGRVHAVVLMVDLGDLREGVWPDDLLSLAEAAAKLGGIRIKGLGTNLACFGGVVPTAENMNYLAKLAGEIEQALGLDLDLISAINSSGLELIAAGKMPDRINHARIGEAILLGRETTQRRPWPDTFQDAFLLHAEILELKRKPSLPLGQRSEDAFGGLTQFEDRGEELRALLNLGRQDVDTSGLVPRNPDVVILGASSDYLVVDVTGAAGSISVGDELDFVPNYSALLSAMTSRYVHKVHMSSGKPLSDET